MKDLILGFSSTNSIIGKTIRFFQKGFPLNHAFSILDIKLDKSTKNGIKKNIYLYNNDEFDINQYNDITLNIIESNVYGLCKSGVKNRILQYSKDKHKFPDLIEIFHIKVSTDQYNKYYEFLTKQIDKKYDFLAIFNFSVTFNLDFNETNRWFCSELVCAGLKNIGLDICPYLEPYLCNIKLLYIYVSSIAYKHYIIHF